MTCRPVVSLLLMLSALNIGSGLRADTNDAIYVFGDSYSDAGNYYNLSGGQSPGVPYSDGRFSNGNVWVQDLESDFGLAALSASRTGGSDFAYGGAESGTTAYHTANLTDVTGPTGQLAQFFSVHPTADPNALYVIGIGLNDLGAIPAGTSPAAIAADITTITGNINTAITTLAGGGARDFLVVNVPDWGKFPGKIAAGPTAAANASAIAAAFNSALAASLANAVSADLVQISLLDLYGLMDSITANPAGYGLVDVTDPCVTGAVNFVGGTACATPNQYLFWDNGHPSAAADILIANAAQALVETPEPASGGLMAAGGFFWVVSFFRRIKNR